MANVLTGDFDVVAQFALPAVNRVLAAMHRVERFPHSIAARVDDTPKPGPKIDPTLISVVNAFGDVPASQDAVGNPSPLSPSGRPSFLDPVVNIGNAVIGPSPIVPSNLKGVVQLQVFPPELEVPDASGTHLTVSIGMLSRYFPDHGTSALAEFIRGDLRVTVPVNQVASQVGNVVDVDIKASTAAINFAPQWSSKPLTAEDIAAINLVIRNSLKTSFLPSNATLPSQIRHMQFRTLSGSPKAVAVMLDLDGAAGNPSSISDVFLSGSDGFAFGVGVDYLRAALQPTLDNILSQPIPTITIDRDVWFHTYHIHYTITLHTATLELESGDMLFRITGHAHTPTSWMPDFDFTIRQVLTLGITGDSAELVVGSMSFDTSSWVVNLFKGSAEGPIAAIRDKALEDSGAQDTVRTMLSANGNLGGFLQSLLKPASGSTNTQPLSVSLGYTSAEIRPSGIVLHGSVAVPPWTPPQVEFEEIPVSDHGLAADGAIARGPDYSALKTWIPGGKITQYSWHLENATQNHLETNRFVFINEPFTNVASAAAVPGDAPRILPLRGYNPMCLTVTGTRPSASGGVSPEQVTGTVCAGLWFPVAGSLALDTTAVIAMTRPGPHGNVEVTGHAPTGSRSGGYDSPNMIIHFAPDGGHDDLNVISRALANSGRDDAPTAIMAVMSSTALANAKWADGVIYAEDDNGAWRKLFGLTQSKGPVTLITDPDGRVRWKSDSRADVDVLTEAMRKSLVKRAPVKPVILAAGARIGRMAPNFLFEYAAGQELTLRKVAGRSALLIFWRSASAASVEAVRLAAQSANDKERSHALIFAINSGESAEVARRVAREVGSRATIVTDADERISDAYAITMWPTLISIDEAGIIRNIQYGRTNGGRSHA